MIIVVIVHDHALDLLQLGQAHDVGQNAGELVDTSAYTLLARLAGSSRLSSLPSVESTRAICCAGATNAKHGGLALICALSYKIGSDHPAIHPGA